jgi:hypothetical protein
LLQQYELHHQQLVVLIFLHLQLFMHLLMEMDLVLKLNLPQVLLVLLVV